MYVCYKPCSRNEKHDIMIVKKLKAINLEQKRHIRFICKNLLSMEQP